jgi:hypothetical protein
MPFYQCFKTTDRTVYCSSTKFKNHDAGATWVAQCIAHFRLRADELVGRPYEKQSQPAGAVVWPDDD